MDVHESSDEKDELIKYLLEKLDDLENRSRRSNLRIIGIPESRTNIDLI